MKGISKLLAWESMGVGGLLQPDNPSDVLTGLLTDIEDLGGLSQKTFCAKQTQNGNIISKTVEEKQVIYGLDQRTFAGSVWLFLIKGSSSTLSMSKRQKEEDRSYFQFSPNI